MTPLLWILLGSVAVFAVLVALIMVLRTRVALARQVSQTSLCSGNETISIPPTEPCGRSPR